MTTRSDSLVWLVTKKRLIPLSFTLAYTAFVLVLVPFYAIGHGLANFLWFSNIALLSTTFALWFQWRLLASMQFVSVAVLELIWTIDFSLGLVLGGESLIGLAGYMFDDQLSLHLRLLSLYHLLLPWLLLWLICRIGYDNRAWWCQTLLAWGILLLCFVVTEPDDNINWTFGLGDSPQQVIAPWLYLALLMMAYPLVVYLPTHSLATWLVRQIGCAKRQSSE